MKKEIKNLIKEFKEVAENKKYVYVSYYIKSSLIGRFKCREEIREGTHLESFLENLFKLEAEKICFFGMN